MGILIRKLFGEVGLDEYLEIPTVVPFTTLKVLQPSPLAKDFVASIVFLLVC